MSFISITRPVYAGLFILISVIVGCGKSGGDVDNPAPDLVSIPVFETRQLVHVSEFGDGLFFSNIAGVDVHTDGTIFVTDYSTDRIYLFDSRGNFGGFIGGNGAGPGEFKEIITTKFITPDSLAVMDWGNRRTTFFTQANGRWSPSRFADHPENPGAAESIFYFPNNVYQSQNRYIYTFSSSFSSIDTTTQSNLIFQEYDHNATLVGDGLLHKVLLSKPYVIREGGRSVSVFPIPENYGAYYAVTKELNLIYNWSANRTITIHPLLGGTSSQFEIHSARLVLTNEEKRTLTEDFFKGFPADWVVPITAGDMIARIPDIKSYVYALHLDDQNRIWVNVNPFVENGPDWLAYSLDGELLAAAHGPGGEVRQIRNNRFYTTPGSHNDEPAFSVYEMIPAVRD